MAYHLAHREIEHLLPMYQSVRSWKDRRVTLQRPLFPGYVFIKLPSMERMKALTIPNALSIVGAKGLPSVISEEEISWIKRGVELGAAEPHPHVTAGTRVVVTSGILSGIEGILLRQENKHNDKTRVLISIDSIFRAFLVEVDNHAVEPVGRSSGQRPANNPRLEIAS